jgi:hypothetical protein
VTLPLRPSRGGFLRPFGCGWFIREFLLGHGPYDSVKIDPDVGAPQSTVFRHYKNALRQAVALDRATSDEEHRAAKEKRRIDPDRIDDLSERYLARLPYKAWGCRYHSFIVYFSNLQRLGWVEATGQEEHSDFQGNYPPGQPRKHFRLTTLGRQAGDQAWANPLSALYGQRGNPSPE